jgi:DNA-directed RNA polymerase subunit D
MNLLRRTIMNLVPAMAIEEVELRKNSSVLYDEIIAHRLGLVVLSTDLKSYSLPETKDGAAEYNAKNSVKLTLKAKGPCTVYASDLKSKDPAVKPVFPKTIIAVLLDGQELELEAIAVLGEGRNHAKWSPALVSYYHNPIITVNNNSPKLEECKSRFPPQIFDKSGRISKDLIAKFSLVDAVDGVCEDVVGVEYEKDNFVLNIEGWGQLTVKEMLNRALEIIEEQSSEIAKTVSKAKA